MTERKFLVLGISGILLAVLAGVAALWLVVSPITKQRAEERTAKDVALKAEVLVSGLKNPWDTAMLPDGTLLFSERGGEISKLVEGKKIVIQAIDDVQAKGEGGLTGMTLDSDFENNKYLYTCYNSTSGDVRVVRWILDDSASTLSDKRTIIDGIPSNDSGRHSGCRVKSGSDGVLWVGTGDAAVSTHPQDLESLGGKILRVSREGTAVSGNSASGDQRIFSYGHRNVQGIALFDEPIDGVYGYSIEHGPNEDDEINLLIGGNFGWDPLAPYNESVPMTDTEKFPEAIAAVWASGRPTIAPSGGTIINDASWGQYQGALAMAVLKSQSLRLITFTKENDYSVADEEALFERDFGRIRSATMSGGKLYLTTDNSVDDKIIVVTPEVKSAN